MSAARHHAEWLSLVEQSGPFLSMPVLLRVLPQGLDAHDPEHLRLLRLAYAEWQESRDDPAVHRAWVRFILTQTLGMPDVVLAEGQAVPAGLKCEVAQHGETLRPDLAVVVEGKTHLLVHAYPPNQDLDRPKRDSDWSAACGTRMMELLHATGVRLGLVTNGERWVLVDAPRGETTGFASWYATFWQEEPVTLRAFRTLLSASRFFNVPEDETLAAMLAESAGNQQEVTDQLGYQVRRAVEVLIQSLDRADQDHGRQLLGEVPVTELYEAALTVMMRLVFLFSAEERGLLLLGDPLYDQHYAVSPLRELLREAADQHGEEVLERRLDAWVRLLSTFRAVHGGVDHNRITLPAYGGHLFDPDRFEFLEGRARHTTWQDTPAAPLPVNNRTVLHLLEALQVLQVKVPGGGPAEARRLSFRALDIEQIGHVYEGLLDHTAKRATEPMLGLAGTKEKEPEVRLAVLEELRAKGEKELLKFLKDATGRSEPALKKALAVVPEGQEVGRFRTACGNDAGLWDRVRPFAGLVRADTFGLPVVIPPGSVYVTSGTDRRSSGTHYTPRSLTDPIVRYTLEPLVYEGPAEGKPEGEWRLRPARDILSLKVCDMATGSGAFIVQSCRYLSERLVEAWGQAERQGAGGRQQAINFANPDAAPPVERVRPRITPFGEVAQGRLGEQIIPQEVGDRLVYARRLVAQRCLYGIDVNPMAVEMAKLSLWLLLMAKGQPFTFLDHAVRCGDSLVGVHDLDQLRYFDLRGKVEAPRYALDSLRGMIDRAVELRRAIAEKVVTDIEDVHEQERMLREADEATERLRIAGDLLVSEGFGGGLEGFVCLSNHFTKSDVATFRKEAEQVTRGRRTFHWPVEFPEVIAQRGGFDAFIGNPPFMGGSKITGNLGEDYREYLVRWLAKGQRGTADLCAYFFLRAKQLLRVEGGFGLIATNTIAQGDTREVGLDQLATDECVIVRAVPSKPWPGLATVEVSHVWGRRGTWVGPFMLDERAVTGITSFLTQPGAITGKPFRLKANEGKSFNGSKIYGQGFVLTPEEAAALIAKDARNKDVLFPYLNGEDLNTEPDQSPTRWVINFFDWPQEKARTYPDCFRIVEEKVKPERDRNNRKERREKWWQYGERCPALYRAITQLDQVMVKSEVGNKLSFDIVPNEWVFSHMLIVFASNSIGNLAVLQSTIHSVWAWSYGSTMRTDLRYSSTDCFETFPLPEPLPPTVAPMGERYRSHRKQIMQTRRQGLTKTYNRFHDSSGTDDDIVKLRELHVEMDRAVATAYGWADLPLDHGFHETRQGVRYTISEAARQEVLARLLRLNHQRYAEENGTPAGGGAAGQGVTAVTPPKRPTGTRGRKATQGGGLFD